MIFLVSSVFINLANFLFHAIVSRSLGPASYGELASMLNIATILTVPFGALQAAITQQVVARRTKTSDYTVRRVLIGSGVISAAIAAGFLVFSPLLSSFLAIGSFLPLFTMAIYLAFNGSAPAAQGNLIGQLRFAPVAWANLAGAVVRLVLALVFVEMHLGIEGAVIATAANAVVTLGVLGFYVRPDVRRKPAAEPVRVPMKSVGRTLIAITGMTAFAASDTVIARHILAPHAAGLYASASVAGKIAYLLPSMISTLVFPRLAADRGAGPNARRNLMISGLITMLLGLGAAGGLYLFPHLVTAILFGGRFHGAGRVLRILGFEGMMLGLISLLLFFHIARRSWAILYPWVAMLAVGGAAFLLRPTATEFALMMLGVSTVCVLAMTAAALITTTPTATRPPVPVLPPRQAAARSEDEIELSIVVPHYNPGPRLVEHVSDLLELIRTTGVKAEIVAVSDGSVDGSDNGLIGLGPEVRVIRLAENMGKGMAVRIGLAQGRGRYIGFIDGDGDIPARVLVHFIEELHYREPDIVIGSKMHPDSDVIYPPFRRIMSRGYQVLSGLLFGLEISDTQTGVKIASREALEAVLPVLVERGFAFDLEMLAVAQRLGFRRIVECPVEIRERVVSHISANTAWTMMLDTFAIAWRLRVVRRYDARRRAVVDHPASGGLPVASAAQRTVRFRSVPEVAIPPTPAGKLRILLCNWRDLTHPLSGGAEVWADEVSRAWVRMGHSVTLFSAAVEGRPEREEVDGVTLIRRGTRFSVYKEAREYYEQEARGQFDLVLDEVNTKPFGAVDWQGSARVLAAIHQLCREVWYYEMPLPAALLGRFVLEPRWLSAYRRSPVVTLCDSGKQSLEEAGLEQVSVVQPGYRPHGPVQAEKEQVPTLLYVGRLAHNKRPDHVVKAFALAREKVPNAKLWVVGRGPMAKELQRMAPPGVEFFGAVSEHEKVDLMARAHAIVVTSAREGWALTVTEAAQVGTPAIGYDVAGLTDSIRLSGGVLVQEDIGSLADAIVDIAPRLCAEPDLLAVSPRGVLPWDAVAWNLLAAAGMDGYEELHATNLSPEGVRVGAGAGEAAIGAGYSYPFGPRSASALVGAAVGTGGSDRDASVEDRDDDLPGRGGGAPPTTGPGSRDVAPHQFDAPFPLTLINRSRRIMAAIGVGALVACAMTSAIGQVSDILADVALACLTVAALLTLNLTRDPEGRPLGLMRLRGSVYQWRVTSLIVMLCAVVVCQTWFEPGTVLAYGDRSPPVGTAWLSEFFSPFAWTGANLGARADYEIKSIQAFFQGVGTLLHLSSSFDQRVYISLLFALMPLTILYLARQIGLSPVAGALTALMFTLNAGSVVDVGTNPLRMVLVILAAGLPAIVIGVARGTIHFWSGVCMFALCAPLVGELYSNPPTLLVAPVSVLAAGIFVSVLADRRGSRRAWGMILAGGLALLITSAYWFVPAIFELKDAAISQVSTTHNWLFTMSRATSSNSFWLNDAWGWKYAQYYPYASNYARFPLNLLRYGLPIVGLSVLMLPIASRDTARGQRRLRAAAMLALAGLFLVALATGPNFPGSVVFDALYRLPYGWLLQTPYRFLVIAGVLFALEIGLVFDALLEGSVRARVAELIRARRPRRMATLAAFSVALAIIPAFPIVTGKVVPSGGDGQPSGHVAIPSYWRKMISAVNSDKAKGAVLVWPADTFYHVDYEWGLFTDAFIENSISRPVIDPAPQTYRSQTATLTEVDQAASTDILDHRWRIASDLLSTLRAPLILVRGDVVWKRPKHPMTDPSRLSAALALDPDARLVKQSGPLDLYAISNVPGTGLVHVKSYSTSTAAVVSPGELSIPSAGQAIIDHAPIQGVTSVTPLLPATEWSANKGTLGTTVAIPDGGKGVSITNGTSRKPVALDDVSSIQKTLSSHVSGSTLHVSIPIGSSVLPIEKAAYGSWSRVGTCGVTSKAHGSVSASRIPDSAPSGQESLEITAKVGGRACVSRPVTTNEPGRYLLTFWARRVAGSHSPNVCVLPPGQRRCASGVAKITATDDGWHKYTDVVTLPSGTGRIFLYVLASNGTTSSIEYFNVQVRKLVGALPSQLFLVAAPAVSKPASSLPQLYVLGASAHQGWRAGHKTKPVVTDGLLAGWLEAPGLPAPKPHFGPSSTIRAAQVLSGVGGFVLLLVGAGMLWRRRRRRRMVASYAYGSDGEEPIYVEVTDRATPRS